jgi:MFS family permease
VVLAAALLTLFGVRSRDQVWLIFAVMLARGFSYAFLDAGETALLPSALSTEALGRVNGWRSSAQEGMKLVAPLAGAALYAWHGGVALIALVAAIPLLVAPLYAAVRIQVPRAATGVPAQAASAHSGPPTRTAEGAPIAADPEITRVGPPAAGEPGVTGSGAPEVQERGLAQADRPVGAVADAMREERSRRGVRAGFAVLWRRTDIRVPVLVAAIAIAMSGFTTASLYSVVTDRLGLPSVFLGLLASAQGAGSIAGGLGVGRLLDRFGPSAVAAVGAGIFAVGCLSRLIAWPSALLAGSVLIGVGLPWTLIAGITAVQIGAPDAVLGRVAATSTALMFGPNALALPLGAAAVYLGDLVPQCIAAAVCLITAAWAFTARHPADVIGP